MSKAKRAKENSETGFAGGATYVPEELLRTNFINPDGSLRIEEDVREMWFPPKFISDVLDEDEFRGEGGLTARERLALGHALTNFVVLPETSAVYGSRGEDALELIAESSRDFMRHTARVIMERPIGLEAHQLSLDNILSQLKDPAFDQVGQFKGLSEGMRTDIEIRTLKRAVAVMVGLIGAIDLALDRDLAIGEATGEYSIGAS